VRCLGGKVFTLGGYRKEIHFRLGCCIPGKDEVTMGRVSSYLPSRRVNVLIMLSHVIEFHPNLLTLCSL
jgi:hypothetical protein